MTDVTSDAGAGKAAVGATSTVDDGLVAELEAELAIHRRAAELIGKVVPPKDGSRRSR